MTRTHCKHGHPWTDENTFFDQRLGYVRCKQCRSIQARKPGSVTCQDCGSVRFVKNVYGAKTRCRDCTYKARGSLARVLKCPVCGSSYRAAGQRALRGGTCSVECSKVERSRKMTATAPRGKDHPQYVHGKHAGRPRRSVWSVKSKGETCCRVCESSRTLHLHHAIPRSKHRAGSDELRNGITLCASCHARWHQRTLTIYRDVFTPDEWEWLASVRLTGERIEAWLDKNYPARPVEWREAA